MSNRMIKYHKIESGYISYNFKYVSEHIGNIFIIIIIIKRRYLFPILSSSKNKQNLSSNFNNIHDNGAKALHHIHAFVNCSASKRVQYLYLVQT